MHFKNSSFKILSSNRGNLLVSILALTTFMSASLYGISQILDMQSSTAVNSVKGVDAQFALSAFLDYTIQGIKQNWCFDQNLSKDTNCNLQHTRSVERLIMSNETLGSIQKMASEGIDLGPMPPISQIQLQQFELNVEFSKLTALHPLRALTGTLESTYGLKGIYVKVMRDTSKLLPLTGKEVYLSVYVEMIDANGYRPARYSGKPLRASARVITYQRALNTFALIVPRSLRLDLAAGAAPPNKGDIVIGQAGAEARTWPGLTFKSPVFINQDLNLPATGYAPVVFAERIILGQGMIRKGTEPFSPIGTGSSQSRWSAASSTFGGLYAGIAVDGKFDKGLVAGWWGQAITSVNASLAKLCLDRNQFLWNTDSVSQSELYGNLISSTDDTATKTKTFTYLFNWTGSTSPKPEEVNDFLGQDMGAAYKWITNGWKDPDLKVIEVLDPNKKVGATAYLNVTINYGPSNSAAINLGRNESSSIQPDLVGLIDKQIADAQAIVNSAIRAVDDAQKDLSKAQKDYDLAKDNPAKADELPALQNEIDKATATLKIAEANLANVQNNLSNKKNLKASIEANPPAISLTTKEVITAGYGNPQPNLISLTIGFKNTAALVNSQFLPVPISISVVGYDSTYKNMNSLLKNTTPNQVARSLNFGTPAGPSGPSQPNSTSPALTTKIPVFNYPGSWGKLEADCAELSGAQGSQAFGGASWAYDFSPQTRRSWNFKGADVGAVPNTDPVLTSYVFDGAASSLTNSPFVVRSIVGTCTIKAAATLVTGYFTCDKLIIEDRSLPLQIIGTFIVGSLSVPASALKAGITWSSIYSPEALPVLRAAKTLQPKTANTVCNDQPDPNDPIWHPLPSLVSDSNRRACNPISLYEKADNLRWTAVDPDCGLLPGASNNSCRNRPLNFYVIEYSRELSQ